MILTKDDILHEHKGERPTTLMLRKNIMNVLRRHYPQVSYWPGDDPNLIARSPWLIDIKDFDTGGVITIRNLILSGTMGTVLLMKDVQSDPDLKCVIMQVGELLERYKIAREKALEIRESIYGMPRDWRGHAIADMG